MICHAERAMCKLCLYEEEKEEFICRVSKNNTITTEKDTLTGCQGGYTHINAGRL